MPPVREIQKGPNLSCKRPATMKLSANTTTAMVNTIEVSARFHPNSFSNGATNTLHAYRVPSAMFIISPPKTRHQRFMPVLTASIDPAGLVPAIAISYLPFEIELMNSMALRRGM